MNLLTQNFKGFPSLEDPISKSWVGQSSQRPQISIIIPAFNEARYLKKCLDSVLRQETDIPYEVIVVDNHSQDATPQIALQQGVRLVQESHRGLTHAREAGYRAARAPLLAYVDADSIVPYHWVDAIYEAFQQRPEAIALCGSFRYVLKSTLHRFIFSLYFHMVEPVADFFLKGQRLAGGNFAVRKEALQKIGGFNLEIEFYGEDMELASRLKKVGAIVPMGARILSSGRRFDKKGIVIPGFIYLFNYLWLFIFKKPIFSFYDVAEEDVSYSHASDQDVSSETLTLEGHPAEEVLPQVPSPLMGEG
ncbi:MAG: glycosyltransferase [Deltaproteobacteria bacterium]|nr:glycosyltransferase [Deltaproteobacteria bacterium]